LVVALAQDKVVVVLLVALGVEVLILEEGRLELLVKATLVDLLFILEVISMLVEPAVELAALDLLVLILIQVKEDPELHQQ
tara:strand:- start:196 stop:438 length:243 start_codon:yes stop_codon:yes gene_type:complete